MSFTVNDLQNNWLLSQLGLSTTNPPNLSNDDLWYMFLQNNAPGGIPGTAPGTPSYVGAASGYGSNSAVVTLPAHQSGDFMLLTADSYGGAQVADVSGWTTIDSKVSTGSNNRSKLYTRVSDGTEPSVTIGLASGSDLVAASVIIYRGVNTTIHAMLNSIDVEVAPAITTSVANCQIIHVFDTVGSAAGVSTLSGGTDTARTNSGNNAWAGTMISTNVQASPGTNPAQTANRVGSAPNPITWTVALAPQSETGGGLVQSYTNPYPLVLSKQFATQTVTNTASETTVFTGASIPANSIDVNKSVFTLGIDGNEDSSAASGLTTLRLKANGTTILTAQIQPGSTGVQTGLAWSIDATILPVAANTLSVVSNGQYISTNAGQFGPRAFNQFNTSVALSSGMVITATIQNTTATAGDTVRVLKSILSKVA